MDFEELLRKLQEQVAFWQKDNPTTPLVNQAKGTIRDVGRTVDDQILGGTFQANMRGQDALMRQLALNAAAGGVAGGVGFGVGKAGTKLAPKVSALMEWIKPRDIGVHLSPFPDLKKIEYGYNTNMGARESIQFPLLPNMTYKLSSTDINNVKIPAKILADSAENYSGAIYPLSDLDERINAYITRSKIGNIDPELEYAVGREFVYDSDDIKTYGLNSRVVPTQKVVNKMKVTSPDTEYPQYPKGMKEELKKLIELERRKELARSILRGSAVGGAVVAPASVLVNKK